MISRTSGIEHTCRVGGKLTEGMGGEPADGAVFLVLTLDLDRSFHTHAGIQGRKPLTLIDNRFGSPHARG
jgi:hypothetical protein